MEDNSYFDNFVGTIFNSYFSNRLKDITIFESEDNDPKLDSKYNDFIKNLKEEKIPFVQKKKKGFFSRISSLFKKKSGGGPKITSNTFSNLITNLEEIITNAKPNITIETVKDEIYFSKGNHTEALNSFNKSKEWTSILDSLSQIRLRCSIINIESGKIEDPAFMNNYSFQTYNASFFEHDDKENKDGFYLGEGIHYIHE